MGKALIIAEKPSVARDIARALGVKAPQKAEFFEDDDYVISSAVGHLLEIKAPVIGADGDALRTTHAHTAESSAFVSRASGAPAPDPASMISCSFIT